MKGCCCGSNLSNAASTRSCAPQATPAHSADEHEQRGECPPMAGTEHQRPGCAARRGRCLRVASAMWRTGACGITGSGAQSRPRPPRSRPCRPGQLPGNRPEIVSRGLHQRPWAVCKSGSTIMHSGAAIAHDNSTRPSAQCRVPPSNSADNAGVHCFASAHRHPIGAHRHGRAIRTPANASGVSDQRRRIKYPWHGHGQIFFQCSAGIARWPSPDRLARPPPAIRPRRDGNAASFICEIVIGGQNIGALPMLRPSTLA